MLHSEDHAALGSEPLRLQRVTARFTVAGRELPDSPARFGFTVRNTLYVLAIGPECCTDLRHMQPASQKGANCRSKAVGSDPQ